LLIVKILSNEEPHPYRRGIPDLLKKGTFLKKICFNELFGFGKR